MSSPKFEKFYQLMWQNNQLLLSEFKKIHDQYQQDQLNKEIFNSAGVKVMDVIRDWERRLCHGMERGQFAKYSEKLADKFWNLARKDFPLIDQVGVKKK